MEKRALIRKVVDSLEKLPKSRITEVRDFTEFLLKKWEEESLQAGIEHLITSSQSFDFLNDEEELYSVEDLKERY